jgi:hypothetical protein
LAYGFTAAAGAAVVGAAAAGASVVGAAATGAAVVGSAAAGAAVAGAHAARMATVSSKPIICIFLFFILLSLHNEIRSGM